MFDFLTNLLFGSPKAKSVIAVRAWVRPGSVKVAVAGRQTRPRRGEKKNSFEKRHEETRRRAVNDVRRKPLD